MHYCPFLQTSTYPGAVARPPVLHSPQPIDPELVSYIKSFNPEATAEKLGNTLNIEEPCLRNLRIAETLLMEGVAAGLTLYDIAW